MMPTGLINQVPTYQSYGKEFLSSDLSRFLEPAGMPIFSFESKYPADFLDLNPPARIPVWHLVGGLDPLEEDDLRE